MKSVLLLVALLCASQAYAGSETGTVRFEHGQFNSSQSSAGYTFFYLDGSNKTNVPACSSFGGGERWVINNNWPAASMQVSIL